MDGGEGRSVQCIAGLSGTVHRDTRSGRRLIRSPLTHAQSDPCDVSRRREGLSFFGASANRPPELPLGLHEGRLDLGALGMAADRTDPRHGKGYSAQGPAAPYRGWCERSSFLASGDRRADALSGLHLRSAFSRPFCTGLSSEPRARVRILLLPWVPHPHVRIGQVKRRHERRRLPLLHVGADERAHPRRGRALVLEHRA